MSQLRLNLLTGRWVTVVPSRAKRTSDFAPRAQKVENDPDRECPFCPDSTHAHDDVPLLENVDAAGNWQLRVIATPHSKATSHLQYATSALCT